jgi:hypothetical protein
MVVVSSKNGEGLREAFGSSRPVWVRPTLSLWSLSVLLLLPHRLLFPPSPYMRSRPRAEEAVVAAVRRIPTPIAILIGILVGAFVSRLFSSVRLRKNTVFTPVSYM